MYSTHLIHISTVRFTFHTLNTSEIPQALNEMSTFLQTHFKLCIIVPRSTSHLIKVLALFAGVKKKAYHLRRYNTPSCMFSNTKMRFKQNARRA